MSTKSIAIPKARPSTSSLFDRSPKDASYSSWSSACSNASTSCTSSPARSQRRGSLLSESAPSRDVTAARDSLEQPAAKNALEFVQYKILTVTGTSLAKEQSTVINIGEPEGPPRLISYLSSSQGFDWNPEIFLPSYLDCEYTPLENRREPVHEIRLTDEEMKAMLPQ